MNKNPPIMPKYIHVGPKLPSGIKNAPIIPPIIRRYLMPQKLKKLGIVSKIILRKHAIVIRKIFDNHRPKIKKTFYVLAEFLSF